MDLWHFSKLWQIFNFFNLFLLIIIIVFIYPASVYWDSFLLISIQGVFSAPAIREASFCKPYFSSYRLAEDNEKANTQNYHLCMAKDGDFVASWPLHFYEGGVGALRTYSCASSSLLGVVEKVLCEGHVLLGRSSPPESLLGF